MANLYLETNNIFNILDSFIKDCIVFLPPSTEKFKININEFCENTKATNDLQ